MREKSQAIYKWRQNFNEIQCENQFSMIHFCCWFFLHIYYYSNSLCKRMNEKKKEINTLKVWNFQWEFIMEIGLQRKENQINGNSVLFFVCSSYFARIETNCDGFFCFICLQLLSFIFMYTYTPIHK